MPEDEDETDVPITDLDEAERLTRAVLATEMPDVYVLTTGYFRGVLILIETARKARN